VAKIPVKSHPHRAKINSVSLFITNGTELPFGDRASLRRRGKDSERLM
jgi:hypothetical protein